MRMRKLILLLFLHENMTRTYQRMINKFMLNGTANFYKLDNSILNLKLHSL